MIIIGNINKVFYLHGFSISESCVCESSNFSTKKKRNREREERRHVVFFKKWSHTFFDANSKFSWIDKKSFWWWKISMACLLRLNFMWSIFPLYILYERTIATAIITAITFIWNASLRGVEMKAQYIHSIIGAFGKYIGLFVW